MKSCWCVHQHWPSRWQSSFDSHVFFLIGFFPKNAFFSIFNYRIIALTLRRACKFIPPPWWGWWNPSPEFLDILQYCEAILLSVENLRSPLQDEIYFIGGGAAGKPLIFLTRRGIFYGRWRCWRPVASPTMVPSWPPSWILSRIKNHVKIVRNSSFGGLCMENNSWISKLHYLYYMYFHPKMAWPPAIYDVISRNHSNWPSISLSLLSCDASIY